MITQQTQHEHHHAALLKGLHAHLQALTGDARQYDGLLAQIGRARFALLGEASHGTHEFYRERVEITERLITKKALRPLPWRPIGPTRGASTATYAACQMMPAPTLPVWLPALSAWMWRNTIVREFVEWLRHHNTGLSPLRQVGFYGLDLYSLFRSIQAVLTYLDRLDPQAARRARYRYLLRPCGRRQPGLWLCRQHGPQGQLRGRGGAAAARNEPPRRRNATDARAGA